MRQAPIRNDLAQTVEGGIFVDRQAELGRIARAVRDQKSLLVWGTRDAGKTSLITKVIGEMPACEQQKCIYWTGIASGRELTSHVVRELYRADDPFVRMKIHADHESDATLDSWITRQSVIRLRGILFTAFEKGDYRLFLDHVPPVSSRMARFMKEITWRCKTPVYLAAEGITPNEIGFAWSLYWTDEYRLHIGPLPDRSAHDLLEVCIRKFALDLLDLDGFREEVLRLSGNLPGSIVKMCELSADPRYHYGDQIKLKLVHVDYLIQGSGNCASRFPNLSS